MASSVARMARDLTSGASSLWGTVRRNHAIEHATVHLLAQRDPTIRLVGRSTPSGFYLYGPVDTEAVARAANDALLELQRDPDLAVHPRCGTNLAVTGLVAGLAAFAADSVRTRSRAVALPQVLLASLWGVLAAQPLGMAVQRSITTSPDVAGARIGTIQRRGGKPITHFVPVIWR
ncbi:MAG: DUF6391 domain-containing protein [Anaerolineae bacterium]